MREQMTIREETEKDKGRKCEGNEGEMKMERREKWEAWKERNMEVREGRTIPFVVPSGTWENFILFSFPRPLGKHVPELLFPPPGGKKKKKKNHLLQSS